MRRNSNAAVRLVDRPADVALQVFCLVCCHEGRARKAGDAGSIRRAKDVPFEKVTCTGTAHIATLACMTTARLFVAVVDDEPAVCKAVARLLRCNEIDVVTFTGGAALISSLASRKPDCVLLDINMPDMNGFDVQSQLAADPATGGIAIVFMTGNDSPELESRVRRGRPFAQLKKPFEAQALLDAIRSAINARGV